MNYLGYILGTTGALFIPIVGLLWFGKANQSTALTAPPGATNLDITGTSFAKRSFAPANLSGPAPVGFFVNGDVTFSDGRLTGTASGQVTRPALPFQLPPTVATQVVLHLCYYKRQPGIPYPIVALAPPSPQASNTGRIEVPIPVQVDQVVIPSFTFDIEIPKMENPEVAWLCAIMATNANQLIAFVN